MLLADDNALFRSALKAIIAERAELKVVGEAGDGAELIRLLDSCRPAPDLCLIDVIMPNLGGMAAAADIIRRHPDVKVMFISMHREREYVHHALSVGAHGYLLKQDVDQELFSAIEAILKGGVFISSGLRDMAGDGDGGFREGDRWRSETV